MRQLNEFYDRLIKFAYDQAPHGPHITRYSMYRALKGKLAQEDSVDKRAAVISGSEFLARLVGLNKTEKLSLTYPEFTFENLALLDDAYDFVISDQVIEHCRNIGDVASESMRVLRPGGWFVHTTCFINVVHGAPSDFWRFTPAALGGLFPDSTNVKAEGWGNRIATMLMESGRRFLPVPEDTNNPIHQIAVHNEPDWPISIWVTGQKASSASRTIATVNTRKSSPRTYSFKAKPAKFGAVACVRNEAPYLLEWIAHYRVLGFDQITIYDNESNDASSEILGPLADAGIVNAVFWQPDPNQSKQISAYNDAQRRLLNLTEWCLYVDLDEYLVLDEGLTLDDLLPRDPGVSSIGIPWRVFGSNGQQFRKPGLTIERFTRAAVSNNEHIKSLVRLRDVKMMNVHMPDLAKGRAVDLQGQEIPYATFGKLGRITDGPARINHYFCRSIEEFECKRARGRGAVTSDGPAREAEMFHLMNFNEMEVRDALRLAPAVKEEIARLQELVRK